MLERSTSVIRITLLLLRLHSGMIHKSNSEHILVFKASRGDDPRVQSGTPLVFKAPCRGRDTGLGSWPCDRRANERPQNRFHWVGTYTYSSKSVDRIATQSMAKIVKLWRLIVVDCDYTESYGRFLSWGNADTIHAVYKVPDDSWY